MEPSTLYFYVNGRRVRQLWGPWEPTKPVWGPSGQDIEGQGLQLGSESGSRPSYPCHPGPRTQHLIATHTALCRVQITAHTT